MKHRIGVCSWSLHPRSPEELAQKVGACGLQLVQLALDPLRKGAWSLEGTRRALRGAGITLASGMMAADGEDYSTLATIRATGGLRPDATWAHNLAAARANAKLAKGLGLTLVSFHPGVLPHDRKEPLRKVLVQRLREVVDAFGAEGVRVALETGQEPAETVRDVLDELGRPATGVNFDPANMLLYGTGEPSAALETLLPHVLQVHIKDARPAARPGEWGTEVVAGTGAVDWKAFFGLLARNSAPVDLLIEREAGDQRVADIAAARRMLDGVLEGK